MLGAVAEGAAWAETFVLESLRLRTSPASVCLTPNEACGAVTDDGHPEMIHLCSAAVLLLVPELVWTKSAADQPGHVPLVGRILERAAGERGYIALVKGIRTVR